LGSYVHRVSKLSAVVAANVRAERSRRGWTQEQLAEALGTARATVGHIETGRRAVTVDDLESLCRVLSIPLRRLFVGADASSLMVLRLDEA